MASDTIQTVTGPISPGELGRTLMHEHVMCGFPGWETHTVQPGPSRDEARAVGKDRIAEIQDYGVAAMIDPCPADLGRNVPLMAELADATGFKIIAATGLYKESEGGSPYWRMRGAYGRGAEEMAELFILELTVGVGDTDIRAGIIKVATGVREITQYERMLLEGAAMASVETGAPITTHTDEGTLGDEQQAILCENGVAPQRIIIGHSCGTDDHAYHMKIAQAGSYLGFDRFGLEFIQPDELRVSALLKLLQSGAGDRVVVSHDSVWCWRGAPLPADLFPEDNAAHFFKQIVPKLKSGGASDAQIETLLVDNPRRFFQAESLPELAS